MKKKIILTFSTLSLVATPLLFSSCSYLKNDVATRSEEANFYANFYKINVVLRSDFDKKEHNASEVTDIDLELVNINGDYKPSIDNIKANNSEGSINVTYSVSWKNLSKSDTVTLVGFKKAINNNNNFEVANKFEANDYETALNTLNEFINTRLSEDYSFINLKNEMIKKIEAQQKNIENAKILNDPINLAKEYEDKKKLLIEYYESAKKEYEKIIKDNTTLDLFFFVEKSNELATSITEAKYIDAKKELNNAIDKASAAYNQPYEKIVIAKQELFEKYFDTIKKIKNIDDKNTINIKKILSEINKLEENINFIKDIKELNADAENLKIAANKYKKNLFDESNDALEILYANIKSKNDEISLKLKNHKQNIANQHLAMLEKYKQVTSYANALDDSLYNGTKSLLLSKMLKINEKIKSIDPNNLHVLSEINQTITAMETDYKLASEKVAEISAANKAIADEKLKEWVAQNVKDNKDLVTNLKSEYITLKIINSYDTNRFENYELLANKVEFDKMTSQDAQNYWNKVLEDIKTAKTNITNWKEKIDLLNSYADKLEELNKKLMSTDPNNNLNKFNDLTREAKLIRSKASGADYNEILRNFDFVKRNNIEKKENSMRDTLNVKVREYINKLSDLKNRLDSQSEEMFRLPNISNEIRKAISWHNGQNRNNVQESLQSINYLQGDYDKFTKQISDAITNAYNGIAEETKFKVTVLVNSQAGGTDRYQNIIRSVDNTMNNFRNSLDISAAVKVINEVRSLNSEVNRNISPAYNYGNSVGINNSKWMSRLKDSVSIHDLSLPGTHDSGMYDDFVGSSWGRTQAHNWENQLKMGIRWFDVRINRKNWIYHGIIASNTSLEDSINRYIKFLESNPSEFIFMKIKDENERIGDNESAWGRDILEILKRPQYQKYLYVNNKNSNDINVGDVRGKIVILNHMHHKIINHLGYGLNWHSEYKFHDNIQDDYQASVRDKIRQIKKMLDKANSNLYNKNEKSFVNYFNVASTPPFGKALHNYAREINQEIFKHLLTYSDYRKIGVIVMDFPGFGLANMAIEINKRAGNFK
ncbi:lipoprotein 17-related variable surface protein [Mycoplasmopsis alligatoris]|uniref:1-phosphatidylinositol phosphodiesterase n=1 Tax=Mycoplasmopsis alligatoris A21JP2 TaxID=747682 RepID=D4XUY5_9BACT|nr:lipoprotein 17-related variable surface protein [Mycoplasmopsis alligatoris]EFF41873.1 phosphatidylinositol-specific phospholipase C, X domain protein [Mycoplasmopsis alligatoris A21JP2]